MSDRRLQCGCIMGPRFICVEHCGGHAIPNPVPVVPQAEPGRAARARCELPLGIEIYQPDDDPSAWMWRGQESWTTREDAVGSAILFVDDLTSALRERLTRSETEVGIERAMRLALHTERDEYSGKWSAALERCDVIIRKAEAVARDRDSARARVTELEAEVARQIETTMRACRTGGEAMAERDAAQAAYALVCDAALPGVPPVGAEAMGIMIKLEVQKRTAERDAAIERSSEMEALAAEANVQIQDLFERVARLDSELAAERAAHDSDIRLWREQCRAIQDASKLEQSAAAVRALKEAQRVYTQRSVVGIRETWLDDMAADLQATINTAEAPDGE